MINLKKTAALLLALSTVLAGSAYADSGKIIASAPVAAKPAQTGFSLKTGTKEMTTRTVEGTEVKVEVVHYTMQPYNILFAMDSDFKPVVAAARNSVTFSRTIKTTKQKISVTLQMFKGKTFNAVGTAMQKEFVSLGYKRAGKVELNEKGRMHGTRINYTGIGQYAGYTLYSVKGGILVVKHVYPLDAGDGMGGVMYQLGGSLKVK
jgi:hypothetical protein